MILQLQTQKIYRSKYSQNFLIIQLKFKDFRPKNWLPYLLLIYLRAKGLIYAEIVASKPHPTS